MYLDFRTAFGVGKFQDTAGRGVVWSIFTIDNRNIEINAWALLFDLCT